jgi:hypothetical protein
MSAALWQRGVHRFQLNRLAAREADAERRCQDNVLLDSDAR